MATIKAIEHRSVHHIQSGQVIVDLNSVVKELVENAIDAGATSIEVRFKNQGLDSIEVQDNGKGIAPDDYESIALKHHTSKLSNYEDLTSLNTFGFRGEALSSLCALSKFHILTARAEDGAVGKRLDFEVSGKLKGTSVSAAQKGTTVYVEDLFYSLPVRRKELEKNIKREYGKVLSLLYAYACISVGVKFSVSSQMAKGKKVPVFSTKSNTTTKENITNVFGTRTLLALVKLDLHLAMAPSIGPSTQGARNWSTQATDRSMEVHVQGHISKPIFGEGRQAPDRQMFFVNGRPCQLPQVLKAFREVYKGFNISQEPFIFANLVMDTNAYDVNVSPDKRTIMLHDQTAMIETLKEALTKLFEKTDHTVPQSTLPNRKMPAFQPLTLSKREFSTSTISDDHAQEKSDEESENESAGSAASPATRETGPRAPPSPANLIDSWAGRDTEQRKDKKLRSGLKKDKQKLPDAMHSNPPALPAPMDPEGVFSDPEAEINEEDMEAPLPVDGTAEVALPLLNVDAVHNPDPLSTPYGDLFSQPPPRVDSQVRKFNDSIQRAHEEGIKDREPFRRHPPAPHPQFSPAMGPPSLPVNQDVDIDMQPSIPAITPGSQKSAPGPIINAFDRMRPKRTPQQVAEITVGDVTTTTVIGDSPPYKRRRVHQPEDSRKAAPFGTSPLLAGGLRKNFAAPGSQLAQDIDSSALFVDPTPPDGSDDEQSETGDAGDDLPEAFFTSGLHTRAVRQIIPALETQTSDALEDLPLGNVNDDSWDDEYLDEDEKKNREDERVARLIKDAEEAAARPTEDNLKRAARMLKNGGTRKSSTLQTVGTLDMTCEKIRRQLESISQAGLCCKDDRHVANGDNAIVKDELDAEEAESRLSLTVTKADFARMRIIGQFNLGFILAVRPGQNPGDEDDLFIIDQHAADEKYNYERLQRTVTLQSQRLVRPKPLELTAIEEEIIFNNTDALKANGFEIESTSFITDSDEPVPSGRRCRLLTLPMSKEKTFDLSDLEELLHLLSEHPAGSSEIPRPKKVQRMLAMRACRSSIMVGKTLTMSQMKKVVRHMGEMEKPWNCPHGRPTMRHLAGLSAWKGWREGVLIDEEERNATYGDLFVLPHGETDWKGWLESR